MTYGVSNSAEQDRPHDRRRDHHPPPTRTNPHRTAHPHQRPQLARDRPVQRTVRLDRHPHQEGMTMYVYVRSEATLWTVGFYRPDGRWESESDHGSADEAARRVAWLNGGRGPAE